MKTLYFECNMGASGDMLLAALYELLPDPADFLETMNALMPEVRFAAVSAKSCGIAGTHMEVSVNGGEEQSEKLPGDGAHSAESVQQHRSPADIRARIERLALPDAVRKNARAVYDAIAEAEAAVHGVPVGEVHFHELGALDAVADVTGVCYALHLLAPDAICVSTVHTGFGQVRCAHGLLPVPAPATTKLLTGIPVCAGTVEGELCTPTGAALLRHFGQSFGPMPPMTVRQIGVGIGRKTFEAANCVRAFWGEAAASENGEIVELCCNIDDMTAEALAFCGERMMGIGALDVSFAPVTMKKGRPGTVFTVLCRTQDESRLAEALLRETNTNGVRSRRCQKYVLTPSKKTAETKYGPIAVKCAEGFGISHAKPEYESVAAAARETGLPFREIWEEALSAIRSGSVRDV
ncbi:MAG: nickel pincer cofactor biosynthesis protein LarC [Oscillospiraceae bacterium]|jgi:uncharacterized protein (TIGR00299 family) protein